MSIKQEYNSILEDLASTMLDVARESVSLVKRSDQEQAAKLSRKKEWDIYLEFVKVMFNLADRISVFHLPVQRQPEFMDGLEDTVTNRLKTLLAPTLSSSEIDDQEVTLSIGQAVAESRRTYERYKFVVSENSKEKDGYFQYAGERIATCAGASSNQAIISAAGLCARAIIPAMIALFENTTQTESSIGITSSETIGIPPSTASTAASEKQSIKLISMVSSIAGEEVETRWSLFPQFRHDLKPDQVKALTQYMNRVARIVGERFAVLSSKPSNESAQHSGHA